MPETTPPTSGSTIELTTGLVSAYVANNPLPATELPGLILSIGGALSRLATGAGAIPAKEALEPLTPAQIRKSITPGGLVSFLDGKPYKTLKRHLTKHGLDPARYRERFGLPSDYPMTCPGYSAQRSALAKQMGLGQRPAAVEEPVAKPRQRAVRQAAE